LHSHDSQFFTFALLIRISGNHATGDKTQETDDDDHECDDPGIVSSCVGVTTATLAMRAFVVVTGHREKHVVSESQLEQE
jgi:hypothetical protein